MCFLSSVKERSQLLQGGFFTLASHTHTHIHTHTCAYSHTHLLLLTHTPTLSRSVSCFTLNLSLYSYDTPSLSYSLKHTHTLSLTLILSFKVFPSLWLKFTHAHTDLRHTHHLSHVRLRITTLSEHSRKKDQEKFSVEANVKWFEMLLKGLTWCWFVVVTLKDLISITLFFLLLFFLFPSQSLSLSLFLHFLSFYSFR